MTESVEDSCGAINNVSRSVWFFFFNFILIVRLNSRRPRGSRVPPPRYAHAAGGAEGTAKIEHAELILESAPAYF